VSNYDYDIIISGHIYRELTVACFSFSTINRETAITGKYRFYNNMLLVTFSFTIITNILGTMSKSMYVHQRLNTQTLMLVHWVLFSWIMY